MEWLLEISFILVLVLLNGFFAGAEIAILTARRGRLEQLAKEGHRGASIAINLAGDPSRFLSTVQVGITIVGTLAAAYGGSNLVENFSELLGNSPITFLATHRKSIALAIVTAIIAMLSLVLGELIPKRVALHQAERLATFVAVPMLLLSTVTRPAVSILGGLTSAVLYVFGIRGDQRPSITIDDIQHLLEAGTQEGLLEQAEKEVAMEALQLGQRRVDDIMRPRIDIDALDVNTPPEEVVGAVAMSGFSRLPVYEGSVDRIVGFVYIKDVFQQHYLGQSVDLKKLLHTPLFVAHTLTLDRLVAMFQEHRTQLAIVLDEFGGTAGMVTFEDVLEELVGDIHDEHRQDDEQLIVQRDDGSWFVDGRMSIDDAFSIISPGYSHSDDKLDVTSISGVVFSALGRLPRVGDKARWEQWELEVADMDGSRVDRVMISLIPPEPPVPPPAETSPEEPVGN